MGDRLIRPRSENPGAHRELDWVIAREVADQLAAEAGVTDEDLAWAEEVLGLNDLADGGERGSGGGGCGGPVLGDQADAGAPVQ